MPTPRRREYPRRFGRRGSSPQAGSRRRGGPASALRELACLRRLRPPSGRGRPGLECCRPSPTQRGPSPTQRGPRPTQRGPRQKTRRRWKPFGRALLRTGCPGSAWTPRNSTSPTLQTTIRSIRPNRSCRRAPPALPRTRYQRPGPPPERPPARCSARSRVHRLLPQSPSGDGTRSPVRDPCVSDGDDRRTGMQTLALP